MQCRKLYNCRLERRKIMSNFKKIFALCTAALCVFPLQPTATFQANAAEVSQLSAETTAYYELWKNKYVVQNHHSKNETQYYVFYGEETFEQAGHTVPVTVSEAHGYGMLIMAAMAEYDSEAKAIFDGMYRYYKAYPSSIGKNLMAWQQSDNGSALVCSEGSDSATDGDMDIAYALLMADKIWGSDGEINYLESAIAVINDIMTYEVNQEDWILRLGDWTYQASKSDPYYSATRGSDFIVQYMPIFAQVTDDDRWLKLYDNTYSIINNIVDEYKTGLMPDFLIKDSTGKFIPAPPNFLESENDGNCYYNSCRAPWRISMDYLVNGNTDALEFSKAITAFSKQTSNNDPWNIMAGYTPDGKAISDWNDLCFVSPLMISASAANDTDWHDSVREVCLNYGNDVYFGETITMLCLIIDDGCWIVPDSFVMGDVNGDGYFNISDAVALQNWLLGNGEIADWKAGDFCQDERIDVYDFCLMMQELQTLPQ